VVVIDNLVVGIMIGVVEEVAVGKKEVVMSLLHHAMIGGRNHRVVGTMVAVEEVEVAAAVVVVQEEEEEEEEQEEVGGKKVIRKRQIGPSQQQGMNALNMSCLVQAIQASILTNMRIFPWRRRETMYQTTLSV
jgi:hypothetical protein